MACCRIGSRIAVLWPECGPNATENATLRKVIGDIFHAEFDDGTEMKFDPLESKRA